MEVLLFQTQMVLRMMKSRMNDIQEDEIRIQDEEGHRSSCLGKVGCEVKK